MTSELIIMRGLPASGKTTWATAWVDEDPANRLRVNRDSLRDMLHGGKYIKGITEKTVIRMRDKVIDEALCTGLSVVSDDCNLSSENVRGLMKIAKRCNADVRVEDLTNVDHGECHVRNMRRKEAGKRSVTAATIVDMYQRYVKGREYPLSVPKLKPLSKNERVRYELPEPYDSSKKPAVIFDIDGTLAHMDGRSPYDYTKVHTDLPDAHLTQLVHLYEDNGYKVIFLSGRPTSCREETRDWISKHVTSDSIALLMRADGDRRDDAQVKYELFDKFVRDFYAVEAVYDDRNRVVEMWREIGLRCYQVAPGNF